MTWRPQIEVSVKVDGRETLSTSLGLGDLEAQPVTVYRQLQEQVAAGIYDHLWRLQADRMRALEAS